MFFSADLLLKKGSGFALAWLAATLNTRASSIRKLNKKEVANTDVTRLCEELTVPAEPLALRLSASLLLGVCRIYNQKVSLFVGDVEKLSEALKRHIIDLSKSNAPSINMADSSRGKGGFTAAAAPEVELGRNDAQMHFLYDDYAFALFNEGLDATDHTQRARTPGIDTIEFDPEFQGDALFPPQGKGKKGKTKTTPKKRATNTLAEADINLPDADLDLDAPLPLDFDFAGFGGLEGGFLDENLLGLDHFQLGPSTASGADTSLPDILIGIDFDQAEGIDHPASHHGTEVSEARHRPGLVRSPSRFLAFEDVMAPMQFDEMPQDIRGQDEREPSEKEPTPVNEDEDAAKPTKKRRANKKGPSGPILDNVLFVDRKEYQQSREKYTEMLQQENDEMEARRQAKLDVHRAKQLVWGPPASFQTASALTDLWNTLVPSAFPKRNKAKNAVAEKSSLKRTRNDAEAEEQAQRFQHDENGRQGSPIQFFDNDANVEHGLVGQFDFDQPFDAFGDANLDVELGRRGSQDGSRLSGASILPWNTRADDSASGLPGSASRRGSNISGQIPFRPESPLDFGAGHPFRPSATPPHGRRSRATSFLGEGDTQLEGATQEPVEMTLEMPDGGKTRLQQDSVNFLSYARDQAASDGTLFFSDLAPLAATDAAVAAQAFYHVLCLASSTFVQVVEQQEADREIKLRVV